MADPGSSRGINNLMREPLWHEKRGTDDDLDTQNEASKILADWINLAGHQHASSIFTSEVALLLRHRISRSRRLPYTFAQDKFLLLVFNRSN